MAITAFFTLVGAWYLTSILKLPVMLGLSIPFLGTWLWLRQSSANTELPNRWLMSFFFALFLLGLIIQFKIYPVNVGVLMSAGLAMALIYSGALQALFLKAVSTTTTMCQMDRKATLAYFVTFAVVLIIGTVMSIKIGLSWDAGFEQQTFSIALDSMSQGLQGKPEYFKINDWGDKYYGIGFYLPAYLLHMPFAQLISELMGMPFDAAVPLSRQLTVFWLFTGSSLVVAAMVYLITRHLRMALLTSITYLLYPYLLGHGMVNVKDSPFAFAWLLSTFMALRIYQTYLNTQSIPRAWVIGLLVVNAWLISIRISGVLFAIPWALLLLFLLAAAPSWRQLVRQLAPSLLTGLFFAVVLVSFLYPVTWQNPFLFFEAIFYLSKYPWPGCTLTAGACVSAQNLPLTYIPHWLFVKLPMFALLGLLLLPLAVFKLHKNGQSWPVRAIAFLALSVASVVLALLLKGVAMYDEIRQILFVVPILFVVAAVTLFFLHKTLAITALALSTILFLVDNAKIFPYQLAWFNEPARLTNINGRYETDYWGTGMSKLAKQVQRKSSSFPVFHCIYAQPSDIFSPFIDTHWFPCHGAMTQLLPETPRPYLYVKTQRSGLPTPSGCQELHVETIELTFSPFPVEVGRIGICE